eukprot:Rhum_TRINITY_DN8270_c0_g1::Rhum_TRINITY_DN8270_c0_g1_i1::g.27040::m.27040
MASVASTRWMLLAAALASVAVSAHGSSCGASFVKRIDEHQSDNPEVYAKCLNASVIRDSPDAHRAWAERRIGSYASNFGGSYVTGFGQRCFHDCLSYGVSNLSADTRTAIDTVKALLQADPEGTENPWVNCTCLMDNRGVVGNTPLECRGPQMKSVTTYSIELRCALLSKDACRGLDHCVYYNDCCFAEGTLVPNDLWTKSREFLNWVFLAAAILITAQVLACCAFNLAMKLKAYLGYGEDGELGQRFLEVQPEKYRQFFAGLPTAALAPRETGASCTICLEDLASGASLPSDEKRVVALPLCEHTFHVGCIQEYASHEALKNQATLCPNCRERIFPTTGPEGPPRPFLARLFRRSPPNDAGAEAEAPAGGPPNGSSSDAGSPSQGRPNRIFLESPQEQQHQQQHGGDVELHVVSS